MVIAGGAGKWYHLNDTPAAFVAARHAEMAAIQQEYSRKNFNTRLGQTLEIATYRCLLATNAPFFGPFPKLDQHDDSKLYEKEEPPGYIGSRAIPDNRRLDFLTQYAAGWAGIECKNIREWIYPDCSELRDLIEKCLYLDCVPVLIARRIHISTFFVLNKCGLIIHQNFNQLLPNADAALAAKAKDKKLLGYHDIRLGNQPDNRLMKFIIENLPKLVDTMRPRWVEYEDLLRRYASGQMQYPEFAARVRRRNAGTDEDGDWPEESTEAPDEEW